MAPYIAFVTDHPFLFVAAGVLILLIIGQEIRQLTRKYRDVGPAEAVGLINRGAPVLDLRSIEAYRKGHVPEAKNVPQDALEKKIDNVAPDKDAPILLYCDAGVSSQKAANQLVRLGYSQVHMLKGGLNAWQRDNLPIAKE